MADLTGNFETGQLPKIAPGGVTVTIARVPFPDKTVEFEKWCADMESAVQNAPGCLGATVLRPAEDSDFYQMVFRFDDALHLRQWERSAVRQALRDRADELVQSEQVTVTAGTDVFFKAQGDVDRHRSAIGRFVADVAWIYPVALIIAIALAPRLAQLDVVPRVLISTFVIAATSKYTIGPIRRWWRRRRMLPQNSVMK